ncbi:FIST signal transduction protein, partial [Hydrogenimonas sp.]
MQQWSFDFNEEAEFAQFVQEHGLAQKSSLLVQVNCGRIDPVEFRRVQKCLREALPHAIVVGASSVSQHFNGKFCKNRVIFSITHFEKSRLSLFEYVFPSPGTCDYPAVAKALTAQICFDTKGILLLTNSVRHDMEELIKCCNELNPNVPIFGGIASDSEPFENIAVFSQNNIYLDEGIIAVLLHGEALHISCNHFFDWEPIGKEFTVTKAEGRLLQELDGQSLIDVYGKYFGPMNKEKFLNISLAYPLIRNSKEFGVVARALLRWEGEKGLFSGEFEVGEKVQIGFGHYKRMMDRHRLIPEVAKNLNAEVVWYFVCISWENGYMDLWKNAVKYFREPEKISFFTTFGEFIHANEKNLYLNYSAGRIALSESENARLKLYQVETEWGPKDKLLATFSTLVSSSSREIMELNHHLEAEVAKRTKELADLNASLERRIALEVKKNREKDKLLYHQSKL